MVSSELTVVSGALTVVNGVLVTCAGEAVQEENPSLFMLRWL